MDSKNYFEEGLKHLNERNYHQKLDKNPTEDHEKHVNNTINDLVSGNTIDEDTATLLRPKSLRLLSSTCCQRFIRKACLDALCMASVSSPTEKTSAFVDEFLMPMAQELPSFIKDTTHFLQKIDKVGDISEDTHMVTLDVKSLHLDTDHDERISGFCGRTQNRSVKNTPSFAIALLMKVVLILNSFVFNGVNYLQKWALPWEPDQPLILRMYS